MVKDATWYRRLADVPGIAYAGDAVLRSRLAERDVVPRVERYSFRGERTTSLMWPTAEGTTSASPAHRLAFSLASEQSSVGIRVDALAALELPGQPMDYHFAMQGAADLLWKRRREEPEHLPFVEWLSWLDVSLVEVHPEWFKIAPSRDEYLAISAFQRLVGVYEVEGFLRDALAAAERFARFRPSVDLTDLRTRVARLDAEHG
jgi:hypothetical protein